MTMEMMLLGNYRGERTSEGLLIKDVEISKETSKQMRPDFLRDLDTTVFKQFIKQYSRRVRQGKVGAFVLLDHEGPGVGRILDLRIQNKELVGDLLITNEEVILKIEKGELTERSIEWGWSMTDAKLKGVALLSGKFGQDSEGWPDLTVSYSKEFIDHEFEDFSSFQVKTSNVKHTLSVSKPQNSKLAKTAKEEQNMSLTADDIKAICAGLTPTIEKIVEQKMGKSADEPVNTGKIDEALAKVAKKELDITITGFVDALARKGYSNKSHLRKSFEKFGDNTTAMAVEYKRLEEKADEDVKLEMEEAFEKPKVEDALKVEFKSFKNNYPDAKLTEEQWVDLQTGKYKADLSGKAINVVEGSASLT